MPFTLSHPAAVLPLMRRPFSRTALVAGAVAPDMPYFVGTAGLPVSAQSWYEPFLNATTTHTALGAITVTLPYALALWGLFHVGRLPLASLLRTSLPPSTPRAVPTLTRRAWWLVLSALIGIATHLVWDAFTHHNGFVVTHVPWLSSTLVGGFTWARTLQHMSTVGGLVALSLYAWRRRAHLRADDGHTGHGSATRRRVLLAMALFTLAGAVAHAGWWLAGPDAATTGLPLSVAVEGVVSDAAKGAGAGLICALALYVIAWWIRRAVTTTRLRGSGAGRPGPPGRVARAGPGRRGPGATRRAPRPARRR
ncbi:DUF4184 family protein [Streptomyces vilmorinianum]|uniref:DUF4184 family protein n=1 Tax=Streptomyces vilmorinianum TaxID=3051092 RepID=UPI0010FAE886|nr:DUF4184 family protein [Streptomyces vilmorinianum]